MSIAGVATRAAAASCLMLGLAPSVFSATVDPAQDYPNKPIRLIVPFVPGAGTDMTGRTIAAKLSERWGFQVVVDNRTGAAGSIGVELTRQATPDGYTLCLISASHTVSVATNPKLPYDLTKDLQAISQATSLFYVIYVNPAVPANSVQQLVAYAKANPGKLNYGSSGTYGLQHFSGEMFSHVQKLYAGIAESLKAPEVAKRLAADGSTPVGTTPEQFGKHISAEIVKWRKLVKEANIKLN